MLGFKVSYKGSPKALSKLPSKLTALGVIWGEDSNPDTVQFPPDCMVCVIQDKRGKDLVYVGFIKLVDYGLCHLKEVSLTQVTSAKTIESLL